MDVAGVAESSQCRICEGEITEIDLVQPAGFRTKYRGKDFEDTEDLSGVMLSTELARDVDETKRKLWLCCVAPMVCHGTLIRWPRLVRLRRSLVSGFRVR